MEELEIIQYSQLDGLRVIVNSVAYRTPHFHPEWELMWVLDRPLLAVCPNRVHRIEPGDVVLFPPNQTHELRKVEGECTFLCLQITPPGRLANRNLVYDDIQLKHFLSGEDYRQVRQMALDIAQHFFLRDELYDLYCTGQCSLLLYKILGSLPYRQISAEEASKIARQNARLRRLVEFVGENFTHKLRLADFARQEGCSVSYLSHFIRERMNQTFQDYVNFVRFSHACKLMAEGEESMVAISMASGFSDYRYFSRAFREVYGMTPAQYRDSAHLVEPRPLPVVSTSASSQEHLLTHGQSLHLLRSFQDQLDSLA